MTSDLHGIAEYVSETAEGHATIIAALVLTLHKAGTLPLDAFRETLHQISATMPENEAASETGAVIERMIDFLESEARSNHPNIDESLPPEKTPDADNSVRTDTVTVPPKSRFARIVQSTLETASLSRGGVSGATKHGSFRTAFADRI